ncbi:MAG TPA: diphosphate--fructose-6-phosphate 1-phosphotransferase [Bryobacteraceae bacterium]|jgi:6-phosphofructokinase 1|nr:diphosphate--fructose-6-phosphate 1-phosphotransferase [Bryobacteraceae bacterium]
MSAAVVAHSGGPTTVLNASLFGIWEEARQHPEITALYGARFGIAGIINDQFVDLFAQPTALMESVSRSPASALGTSRREVESADLEQVLHVLRRHNVRYLFYTGGNGSMGTASQIDKLARDSGYELFVIGVPKTIDNDLEETDHSPGYASAARFFASAVRDISMDNAALPGQVEFIEILGRNAGWLAAATSLARKTPDDAPHLIYLPERPLSLDDLCSAVENVFRRVNRCVVTVCEGQLDEKGEPFGADVRSGSRGSLAMNLAHRLAILVSQKLGVRTRSEKPGLLGRSCREFVSGADWREAREVGREAVRLAVNGSAGKMVTLARLEKTPYRAGFGAVPLESVAYRERLFPLKWICESGTGIEPEFHAYLQPLIGDITKYDSLLDFPPAHR